TYGPRGTLHLLPAAELPLWMAAMRAFPSPSEDRVYEFHGVDPQQLAAVTEAIGDALDGPLPDPARADRTGRRACRGVGSRTPRVGLG
ncbi:MAG: hypothetical protein M3387_08735, partial [Actinomycetota bacterium]|nr:hypothetical protein [Actinomycetota bacterium]